MFAFYYNSAIDFLRIIWDDFISYLNRYTDSCRHPRWIALIINHFLQTLPMESRIYTNHGPPHGLITQMWISHAFETTFPLTVPSHIKRCLSTDSPYYQAYLNFRDHGSKTSSKPTKRKSSPFKGHKQKKSKKTVPPQTTLPPISEPDQPEVTVQLTPPPSSSDV